MPSETLLSAVIVIAVLGANIFYLRRLGQRTKRKDILTSQLQKREALSRAILRSQHQNSNLSDILSDFLPQLFPNSNISIWLFLDNPILQFPRESKHELAVLTSWLAGRSESDHIPEGEALPWKSNENASTTILMAPITSAEQERAIGGLIIELPNSNDKQFQVEIHGQLAMQLQSAESLAESLSAYFEALRRYRQNLELQRVRQELSVASQIQTSFLPTEYPDMPGWQIAVSLEPAGELSGDFFDLIPLPDNRVGVLIADVAGKGLGAALYMALCRTLIRTFAMDHLDHPELVISDCNGRILQDASATLFVTAFYGVLDLKNNTLTYANAGHHPPYLFSTEDSQEAKVLHLSGIPIGIEEGESWGIEQIEIAPGETLLLYSDGVTDAQNASNEEFGSERLLDEACKQIGQAPSQMQNAVLDRIRNFVGKVPQFDDMTLLVLRREESES
jgi:serine phosphatase RsbU (regulator of sigma subunit)